MLTDFLENIRRKTPGVHCIANYVTANDCANLLLAVGASPVMADDLVESAEITSCCDALTLSLGTPNARRLEAMRLSALAAKEKGIPVILDPVGVTMSQMRRNAARELIDSGAVSVIRANASEILALSGKESACGLEAQEETAAAVEWAKRLASETASIIVMTGEIDVITDGKCVCRVFNGNPIQRSITGAGCQMTALLGAFAAANPEKIYEAVIAGTCMMGLCAEIACDRLSPQEGNASCRSYIIDAAYCMTGVQLEEGARYEM